MRELLLMGAGRREHDWDIASSLMCLLAEINRDRKRRSRPFKPAEFNPTARSVAKPVPTTVTQLAAWLPGAKFKAAKSQSI